MNWKKRVLAAALSLVTVLGVACTDPEDEEADTGGDVSSEVNDVGEELGDVGEEAGEAAGEAAEKLGDAAEEAGNELEQTTDDVVDESPSP